MPDVRREVSAPALLAELDQEHLASTRHIEVVVQPHGADGRGHGVAIVRTAAAVELAVLENRRPGTEPLAPALELGLLVTVPVEQHRVVVPEGARNLDQDHGRATGPVGLVELHDLDGRPLDDLELYARPGLEELDGQVHVTGRGPALIEAGRLVGDLDVHLEERNDMVPPEPVDVIHVLRGRRTRNRAESQTHVDRTSCPTIGRQDNNKIGKKMPSLDALDRLFAFRSEFKWIEIRVPVVMINPLDFFEMMND